MNRRSFLRTLAAAPAAYLLAKYGIPGGGEVDHARLLETVGWKAYYRVAILNSEWMPRIEGRPEEMLDL